METLSIVLLAFNMLLSVAGYLMKSTIDDLKLTNKEQDNKIASLQEQKVSKTDFAEFKIELWKRFDKLEDTVNKKM